MMDQAKETGPRDLGRAAHTAQDALAHAERNPPGGFWEHLFGHPDDPVWNPAEWQRSREATEKLIKDYMRSRGMKPKCK